MRTASIIITTNRAWAYARARANALMTILMFTAAFSAINTFGGMKKYNASSLALLLPSICYYDTRCANQSRIFLAKSEKSSPFSSRAFPRLQNIGIIGSKRLGKIFVTQKRFVSKADANIHVSIRTSSSNCTGPIQLPIKRTDLEIF